MLLLVTASALLGLPRSEGTAPGAAAAAAAGGLRALPPPRRALKLQCRGAITTGICGRCPACARTAGERCGGRWDYLGKCDAGLVCLTEPSDHTERRGICTAVLESPDLGSCLPECTLEYCQANPHEPCSARSASLETKACRVPCLHASCSGCLLLRMPACPQLCARSDRACLHRFGRCVHSHLSQPHSALLNHDVLSKAEGFFACLLPNCPNPLD